MIMRLSTVEIYFKWIENYPADDYQEVVRKGSDKLEGLHLSAMCSQTDLEHRPESQFVEQSPSRTDELRHIFIRATEMEVGSWDLGPHQVQILNCVTQKFMSRAPDIVYIGFRRRRGLLWPLRRKETFAFGKCLG